jgi:flavin-dependent dehydrogenase
VLIIGGGPAGSACARRLKQNHVSSILLDKAKFPRFKPCAGWVTPQVLRWAEMDLESYPYGLTEFSSFDVSINGFRFKLPTHQFSIRRFEFDQWLLKRADPEFYQCEVQEIRLDNGEYIVDDEFSARYLVGAGGTHCPVYQTFFKNASPKAQGALIVAQEEEFQYDYKDARCKLWFFENKLPGYAWYVPKKDGYVKKAVLSVTMSLSRPGIVITCARARRRSRAGMPSWWGTRWGWRPWIWARESGRPSAVGNWRRRQSLTDRPTRWRRSRATPSRRCWD